MPCRLPISIGAVLAVLAITPPAWTQETAVDEQAELSADIEEIAQAFPSQDADQQAAAELEAEIDEAIYSGEYDRAAALLETALASFPDHPGLNASRNLLEVAKVWDGGAAEQLAESLQSLPPETSLEDLVEAVQAGQDPEEVEFEKRVDELIGSFQFAEAQNLLKKARQRFPEAEGLRKSEQILTGILTFRSEVRWVAIAALAGLLSLVALIAAFVRRKPLIAAGIYVTAVFAICVPLAMVLGISGSAIQDAFSANQLPPAFNQFFLVCLAAFLGAVGGAINCSFILSHREGHQIPKKGTFAFFFFKPVNGFFLGAVMYLALLSGNLAVFDGSKPQPNEASIGILAALTGLFAENAIAKLRQLSDTLFGGREREEVRDERRDHEGERTQREAA